MKRFFQLLLFMLVTHFAQAQSEQLAQNYFDRGEFEKALISFEDLLKSQPSNFMYFQKTVECYQQLEQFEKADKAIQDRYNKYKQSSLLVELGFNYQLQKDSNKAARYYNDALDKIKKNPNEVYGIANLFEKHTLIDYALQAYETALTKEPKFNFNFQMALLYGQKGDTDQMIEKFLEESLNNPQNLVMIQNQLSRFMIEDSEATFNEALKKALLIRIQKSQDIFWNQYLSWYYVQLKEYGKAFIQEKAIYKRSPESFSNIINLGQLAIADNDSEDAKDILGFVIENTKDLDLQIKSHSYLMEMKIKAAQDKDYPLINQELDNLLKEFGISPYSLSLIKLKAHFVSFNMKNPEEGKVILKNALEMPLNRFQSADIKMELADILVFEEKFNQALIYYSQIQEDMSNDVIGQEANFKIAKTSYFKNDFKWANHQLEVLKSASTQLIANDALDLFLLISDNTVEDSTQTALKKFAHADFLLFQDKKQDALEAFKAILKENKGDAIEPITLLRIGKLYEKQGNFVAALENYKLILDNFKECIYIDEALFYSAEIHVQLNEPEKAKPLYEEIITKHEDSIFYVNAQKKYRQLRGDKEI
ncbi:tetratricopeptide repeat protein [Flavobacterium sp. SUN046]|uniref:tetratricopeptide repeat protein n=1 Tax=Flavobacterium sp. SUN046 TaxID=3002440 RepID=UPI002DBA813B|nr:tetratricopeptide repeat protein [Flavobacterium sp. SUN046]MEC4050805.1 tetratricopeptide repeat protein [Flavobacterium sp. SUN046]